MNENSDVPPLPTLTEQDHESSTKSPRPSSGAWNVLVESAMLHALPTRSAPWNDKKHPVVTRSPLRTGMLSFTEQGICVSGFAKPSGENSKRRLKIVLLWWLFLLMAAAAAIIWARVTKNGLMPLFVGVIVLLEVGMVVFIIRQENQRVAVELVIPWEQVYGLQRDGRHQWLSLVYFPEAGAKMAHIVSLNQLSAATVSGIENTILHFAPHAVCRVVPPWRWTPARIVFYGVLAVICIATVVAAILTVQPIRP